MERASCEEAHPWWLGDALTIGRDGLLIDGVSIADTARRHGTPLYIYGERTLRRRVSELRHALDTAVLGTRTPFQVRYAMKACRFRPVLDVLRSERDVGIDACSPREVERALEAGFRADEISVTAGMLSDRDLSAFAKHGVHVNLDTRSALARWARTAGASREVGLRIDPNVRIGWSGEQKHSYGDSKFGFAVTSVLDAVAFAESLGLAIVELHVHAGWGLQASVAGELATIFAQMAALAKAIPTVRTIDVGGGLPWRQRAEDDPLLPATWASLLRAHLVPTGCVLKCEPGTFLAASAGVLVAEVNTVEVRPSGKWVGVDAGHNVNVYAAHYAIPHAIVSVARPLAPPFATVHVAGNINEANDVFARDLPFAEIEEGELVVLYPAGAYGASMASDHCMRGLPQEVLV